MNALDREVANGSGASNAWTISMWVKPSSTSTSYSDFNGLRCWR